MFHSRSTHLTHTYREPTCAWHCARVTAYQGQQASDRPPENWARKPGDGITLHSRKSEQSLNVSEGIELSGRGDKSAQGVRLKARDSGGITEGTGVAGKSRGKEG